MAEFEVEISEEFEVDVEVDFSGMDNDEKISLIDSIINKIKSIDFYDKCIYILKKFKNRCIHLILYR